MLPLQMSALMKLALSLLQPCLYATAYHNGNGAGEGGSRGVEGAQWGNMQCGQ